MNTISNIGSLELATFLEKNRITEDEFTQANIEWELLKSIGLNHESLFDVRKESAEFFARVIQGCNKVHSVRWRVKDPEHLMEKIIRKRIPDTKNFNKLYLNINIDNYHEMVTDLVGIRALHLFKDDYHEINSYLMERWIHTATEKPTYYYRAGDDHSSVPEIFNKKPHPAGYRSIHYIFESQPLNIKLYSEVQVRTIFEEGWSEIDHKVRYPNFSNNPITQYFLDIFNRLSGNADEMGGFVKTLDAELKKQATLLQHANDESQKLKIENEESIASIDKLLKALEDSEGKGQKNSETIRNLKDQIEKLKKSTIHEPAYKTVTSRLLDGIAKDNVFGGLGIYNSLTDKIVAQRPILGSIQSGLLAKELAAKGLPGYLGIGLPQREDSSTIRLYEKKEDKRDDK